jgi:hypothetical protein
MKTFRAVFVLTSAFAAAQPLPQLRASDNQRFLVTQDGKPFFYLADTAWELFHRLNREQAVSYLSKRASQGYTAIQAVALAELEGLTDPNAYGDLPFEGRDPSKPAVTPGNSPKNPQQYDYWDHVDYIIDQANSRGLYIAFLPTWGRWLTDAKNGDNVLNASNMQAYGEFLGKRYGKKGIIWVLGGDRTATGFEQAWHLLAKGIAIGVSGKEDYSAVLMTFHPRGGETSSTWFHDAPWLDFNMHQTGHGRAERVMSWERIAKDYQRQPVKPVLDGEPLYEDHPLEFRARDYGYSFDAHVRQRAYWSVFSGSCGHTYGNHSVWQMYSAGKRPINGPLFFWNEAVERPGAAQMQFLRRLIESRDYLSRVPAQELIVDPLTGPDYIVATRGKGYAMIYSAQGRKFTVRLGRLEAKQVRAQWFNPRNGAFSDAGRFDGDSDREFVCPSEGFGSDWVLVLEPVTP